MRYGRWLGIAVCLLCAALSTFSAAQNGTGEIRLRVSDSSGARLRAEGTAVEMSSGKQHDFMTDGEGNANLRDLTPGRYRIEVSRKGFATEFLTLDVGPSGAVVRNVSLSLGEVNTSITVYPATPIGPSDVPAGEIPVAVQGVTAKQIEDLNALDLADVLNKRVNGVYINENSGNPYQPDVNYRGYTASPLLGTPEGLSVYLDGVRQNQPFGDVVAWDLIPRIAIQKAELIPGSNPVYGLNTLGGAVAVQTKSGLTNPGLAVQVTGGSFGRRAIEGEYGGANARGLHWYGAGNYYDESGWRERSNSSVRQSFAKVGQTRGKNTFSLSAAYANNFLTGNGTQDYRFLMSDYASVYSVPDITWNHAPSLTLNVTHERTTHLTFSGNVYYRYLRSDTTNGDLNSASFDQSLYKLSNADIVALKAAGYTNFPLTGNSTTEPYPFLRCIAQSLEKDEPVEKCTAVLTDTRTQQNNYGLSGLVSGRTRQNRLAVGAAWDRSTVTYRQESQFGYLNPDGVTITPVDAFADGSTQQDGAPVDTRVALHGYINTPSFYATDTFSWRQLSVTVSGRYNRVAVDNADRLPATDVRGSLDGSYVFQRFNPAMGFTYRASQQLSVYFDYSEASRAPTSIELGCGDPNFPCNLPNALISDPPLAQVVSRTIEVGVRGNQEGILRWSADFFRGQNANDLLFVASEQTGFGYFSNFGKTRREGLEANVSAETRRLGMGAGYTFLSATYQSAQTLNGGSNSSNLSAEAGDRGVDDDITIVPGNRIPQTPQHLLKGFAEYRPNAKILAELTVQVVSSSFARGNENNQDRPDGTYYLGSATSPAYGVADLGAHYQIRPRFQLFVQCNNLLNRRYSTAAQLASTPYDNSHVFTPRPFAADAAGNYPIRASTYLAPGTPISVFGGIRISFRR